MSSYRLSSSSLAARSRLILRRWPPSGPSLPSFSSLSPPHRPTAQCRIRLRRGVQRICGKTPRVLPLSPSPSQTSQSQSYRERVEKPGVGGTSRRLRLVRIEQASPPKILYGIVSFGNSVAATSARSLSCLDKPPSCLNSLHTLLTPAFNSSKKGRLNNNLPCRTYQVSVEIFAAGDKARELRTHLVSLAFRPADRSMTLESQTRKV